MAKATIWVCDVQGCREEATPVTLRFKDGVRLDLCDRHRAEIATAKASTTTAKRTGGKSPTKASAGQRGRPALSPEEKAVYQQAKAWAIAQGTIPSDRRGMVSRVIVDEYRRATGA